MWTWQFASADQRVPSTILIDMSPTEQEWIIKQTYPLSLELKMVCQSPQRIQYLDMEIKHTEQSGFHTVLYDKRDELRLAGKMGVVRRFPHRTSVLSQQCKYACLTSFMHRAQCVCTQRKAFVHQVAVRMIEMSADGYNLRRLQFMMAKFLQVHTPLWQRRRVEAWIRATVSRLQMDVEGVHHASRTPHVRWIVPCVSSICR